MADHQHVRIPRHLVQHGGELGQVELEGAELGAHAREGVLEVLDERGGLLVARAGHGVRAGGSGVRRGGGGDDEEGGAFKENDFRRVTGVGKGR